MLYILFIIIPCMAFLIFFVKKYQNKTKYVTDDYFVLFVLIFGALISWIWIG